MAPLTISTDFTVATTRVGYEPTFTKVMRDRVWGIVCLADSTMVGNVTAMVTKATPIWLRKRKLSNSVLRSKSNS